MLPYLFAVAVEAGVSLASLYVLVVMKAHFDDSHEVAAFLVLRRAGTVILPLLLLGIPSALVYFLAGNSERKNILNAVITAVIVVSTIAGIILCAVLSFPIEVSGLLLGSVSYSTYVLAFFLMLFVSGASILLSAALRGVHAYYGSLSVLFLMFAVLPILAVYLSNSLISFYWSIVIIGSAVVIIWGGLKSFSELKHGLCEWKINWRLVGFGSKVVAGEVMWMILLFVPVYVLSVANNLMASAYFALIISVALVAAAPIVPIMQMFQPKLIAIVQRGASLRNYQNSLAVAVCALAAFGYIAFLILLPYLRAKVLPSSEHAVVNDIIAGLLVFPFAAYYGFRGFVEATGRIKNNVISVLIALVVFVGGCYGQRFLFSACGAESVFYTFLFSATILLCLMLGAVYFTPDRQRENDD